LIGQWFQFRLLLEAAGPDVHLVAELREFLGKLNTYTTCPPVSAVPNGGWAAT
jgi:hypothetical protein